MCVGIWVLVVVALRWSVSLSHYYILFGIDVRLLYTVYTVLGVRPSWSGDLISRRCVAAQRLIGMLQYTHIKCNLYHFSLSSGVGVIRAPKIPSLLKHWCDARRNRSKLKLCKSNWAKNTHSSFVFLLFSLLNTQNCGRQLWKLLLIFRFIRL